MKIRVAAAAAFLSLASLCPPVPGRAAEPPAPGRVIVVSGSGSAAAAPDAVSFQAGATTRAGSAGEALEASNAIMARVRRELAQAGVAERDLSTARFDVAPQFARRAAEESQPPLIGYQVSHVLQVKLRDVSALGGVLDTLVRAGANVLYDVRFTVAEPAPLLARARELAVRDALSKAQALSAAAGVRLGAVRSIAEGGVAEPIQPHMRAELATVVPVAAGEQEYRASVVLSFELE